MNKESKEDRGKWDSNYYIELFKAFTEYSKDFFLVLDNNCIIKSLHSASGTMFGILAEEAQGKYIGEFSTTFDQRGMKEQYWKVLVTGQPLFYSEWINLKGIGEKYVEVRVFRFREELGMAVTDQTQMANYQKQLQARIAFDELIASVSSGFINLPTDLIDKAITNALGKIGEMADVDRCYVFVFSTNRILLSNTHEWGREGIEAHIHNLQNIPCENLPWWVDRIEKLDVVRVPNVDELPEEATKEKELFRMQKIKSLVAVPLQLGDTLFGFFGVDSLKI